MASPDALAAGVVAMRPLLPAKDFAVSRAFYQDLGFAARPLGAGLAEMMLGGASFILQDLYVRQWAENVVMHLLVTDVAAWWAHVQTLHLAAQYGVSPPQAPRFEAWGLEVAYVFDPSGILWHIARQP